MTVRLVQWRAVIGIFNYCSVVISKNLMSNMSKNLGSILKCLFLCFHCFESVFLSLLTFFYIFLLLRSHGDIELKPGPSKIKENLSACHWNFNFITTHNFSKLTQLKAYVSTYKYDFIFLSETYLDSSTHDNLIDIEGYNLVCPDHPDNIKRGGVGIYYKDSLPVRVISLPFFKEALLLEMSYNKKRCLCL